MTWLAKAAVKTDAGRVYRGSVDVSTKTPDLATRREKITAKFFDLCTPVLGQGKAKELAEAVFSLGQVGAVSKLIARIANQW